MVEAPQQTGDSITVQPHDSEDGETLAFDVWRMLKWSARHASKYNDDIHPDKYFTLFKHIQSAHNARPVTGVDLSPDQQDALREAIQMFDISRFPLRSDAVHVAEMKRQLEASGF